MRVFSTFLTKNPASQKAKNCCPRIHFKSRSLTETDAHTPPFIRPTYGTAKVRKLSGGTFTPQEEVPF
jgi:hypothetical protein